MFEYFVLNQGDLRGTFNDMNPLLSESRYCYEAALCTILEEYATEKFDKRLAQLKDKSAPEALDLVVRPSSIILPNTVGSVQVLLAAIKGGIPIIDASSYMLYDFTLESIIEALKLKPPDEFYTQILNFHGNSEYLNDCETRIKRILARKKSLQVGLRDYLCFILSGVSHILICQIQKTD